MEDINDYDFGNLANALADRFNVYPAATLNLLTAQVDNNICELLDVYPAAMNNVINEEAHIQIAELFDMTFAELDNLLKVYGKGLAVGLILGYLKGKVK